MDCCPARFSGASHAPVMDWVQSDGAPHGRLQPPIQVQGLLCTPCATFPHCRATGHAACISSQMFVPSHRAGLSWRGSPHIACILTKLHKEPAMALCRKPWDSTSCQMSVAPCWSKADIEHGSIRLFHTACKLVWCRVVNVFTADRASELRNNTTKEDNIGT